MAGEEEAHPGSCEEQGVGIDDPDAWHQSLPGPFQLEVSHECITYVKFGFLRARNP